MLNMNYMVRGCFNRSAAKIRGTSPPVPLITQPLGHLSTQVTQLVDICVREMDKTIFLKVKS